MHPTIFGSKSTLIHAGCIRFSSLFFGHKTPSFAPILLAIVALTVCKKTLKSGCLRISFGLKSARFFSQAPEFSLTPGCRSRLNRHFHLYNRAAALGKIFHHRLSSDPLKNSCTPLPIQYQEKLPGPLDKIRRIFRMQTPKSKK
jgi:hypothetical protein